MVESKSTALPLGDTPKFFKIISFNVKVLGKKGFEPLTPWFVATCSSPLSYKPKIQTYKYMLLKFNSLVKPKNQTYNTKYELIILYHYTVHSAKIHLRVLYVRLRAHLIFLPSLYFDSLRNSLIFA